VQRIACSKCWLAVAALDFIVVCLYATPFTLRLGSGRTEVFSTLLVSNIYHSFEYTVTVVRVAGLNTDGGRAIENRWSGEDNNRDAIVTEEK
jgi:hypothetical protein